MHLSCFYIFSEICLNNIDISDSPTTRTLTTMPRRKASRAPSRAKPMLPDDSITEPDVDAEQRRKKKESLLADFDREGEPLRSLRQVSLYLLFFFL